MSSLVRLLRPGVYAFHSNVVVPAIRLIDCDISHFLLRRGIFKRHKAIPRAVVLLAVPSGVFVLTVDVEEIDPIPWLEDVHQIGDPRMLCARRGRRSCVSNRSGRHSKLPVRVQSILFVDSGFAVESCGSADFSRSPRSPSVGEGSTAANANPRKSWFRFEARKYSGTTACACGTLSLKSRVKSPMSSGISSRLHMQDRHRVARKCLQAPSIGDTSVPGGTGAGRWRGRRCRFIEFDDRLSCGILNKHAEQPLIQSMVVVEDHDAAQIRLALTCLLTNGFSSPSMNRTHYHSRVSIVRHPIEHPDV